MTQEIIASFKIMNFTKKKRIKGAPKITNFIKNNLIMAKGKIIKQNILTTIVEYKGKHIKRHKIKHCVAI